MLDLLICCFFLHFLDPTRAGMAGREFVFSFMQNAYASHYTAKHILFISAIKGTATVRVQARSVNFDRTITVPPMRSIGVHLPPKIELCASKKSYKTVLIDATADVSITSYSSKKWTADTSVVYPTKTWGTEYLIFTPSGTLAATYNEFSVTNGKQGNKVEIYLQGNVNFENKHYPKGHKLEVDLLPYQALEVQSRDDLTNTRIVSKRPVAVVTGHSCTTHFAKCNHVYEQLLPVSAWGSNFIVPPIRYQTKFDTVYIQASQDTTVRIASGNTKTIHMKSWSVYEHNYKWPTALSIQANHGIQVLLLFKGLTFNRYQFYDPFLINMLSTEYFCSSYLLLPLPSFINSALIVANKDATRKIKFPTKKGRWLPVTRTDFLWMQFSVEQRTSQIVSSSGSPFGLYSFGVGNRNGYGSAGHCVQPGKVSAIFHSNDQCLFLKKCDGFETSTDCNFFQWASLP